MNANYAHDQLYIDIEPVIKEEESVGHATELSQLVEAGAPADSSQHNANRDVLSPYLHEMNTLPLLTRQEELAIGATLLELKEKKSAVTQQWLIVAGEILFKRQPSVLNQPGAYRIVSLCLEVRSLHEKITQLESAIQTSPYWSQQHKMLNKQRYAAYHKIRRIASKLHLGKIIAPEIQSIVLTSIPSEDKNAAEMTQKIYRIIAELKNLRVRLRAIRNRLVQSNQRLVVFVAHKYINRGLALADLIQEGNIGLMRAADKFDCRLGVKFSTYAYWWIRQVIVRGIHEQTRTIRLPVYLDDRIKRLNMVTQYLMQRMGEEPSTAEIGETMGIGSQHIEMMQQMFRDTISLEITTGEEEKVLKDLVISPAAVSPLDDVIREQHCGVATEALQCLIPRDRQIIMLRFGLEDGTEHTLEAIGERFGITRERVRQIERAALRKLRNHRIFKQIPIDAAS